MDLSGSMTLRRQTPTNIKLQGTIMSERFLSPRATHASSGIAPSSLAAKSLLRLFRILSPEKAAKLLPHYPGFGIDSDQAMR